MSRDFAFIQFSPGRLFAGWGPFEQLPFRRPERPAFFITDFFLDDPHPWRHPSAWEELSVEEFISRVGKDGSPSVAWDPPPVADFTRLFESARAAMLAGQFSKIVPVVFESGRFPRDDWRTLVRHLAHVPPGMSAYGYSYQGHGMIGASPEVLFRGAGRSYQTMALAGTRPLALAAELLGDPKELREHRYVVDDIVRRLAPFGNIEVSPLRVLELPTIAHLATAIRFEESSGGGETMSFSEMIRRLHPTAALGVSPRNDAGSQWLREADRGIKRRTFGAPFGVELEDRTSLALVAIRNVQWKGDVIRIGSGAGLLPESRLERELEELSQKRRQVKSLFGLHAEVPAAAVTSRS